jgi:5-methylcytosine-specific restriction endonuclease McrBC regulatory subunit McrC
MVIMMQTDVTLRSAAETIVIDTKHYQNTLSSHLYQIFAYLKNLERAGATILMHEGSCYIPQILLR